MRIPKYLIVLLCVAMSLPVLLFGQVAKTGTTAAKFLSIGIGPRAIAMGGAYASVADDASAMYWNPAGIARLQQNEVIFAQSDWFADINISYIGLVLKAGTLGSFGINVTALTMGEMDLTTENYPEGTGETFDAGSYAFGFTYARNLTQNFIIGANIKYIREDIFNSSAHGVALDIGTIYTTPFYGVRFASSITNFGTKMQMSGEDLILRHDPLPDAGGNNDQLDGYYSTDKFDLPLRLQIGLAKDFRIGEEQRLTIAADASHPNDNTEYVNVGGELAMLDEMVFLRGGFKSLFIEDREEGLTLGAGFRYAVAGKYKFAIDYSFQNFIHLDDVQSFGIIISF